MCQRRLVAPCGAVPRGADDWPGRAGSHRADPQRCRAGRHPHGLRRSSEEVCQHPVRQHNPRGARQGHQCRPLGSGMGAASGSAGLDRPVAAQPPLAAGGLGGRREPGGLARQRLGRRCSQGGGPSPRSARGGARAVGGPAGGERGSVAAHCGVAGGTPLRQATPARWCRGDARPRRGRTAGCGPEQLQLQSSQLLHSCRNPSWPRRRRRPRRQQRRQGMLWQLLRPGCRQFCSSRRHQRWLRPLPRRACTAPPFLRNGRGGGVTVAPPVCATEGGGRVAVAPPLRAQVQHLQLELLRAYPKLVHHEWGYLKAVSRCPRVCRRPRQLHRKKPCISRHWPRTMRRHQLHRLHLQRRQLQLRPGCSRRQRHRHLSGRTSR